MDKKYVYKDRIFKSVVISNVVFYLLMFIWRFGEVKYGQSYILQLFIYSVLAFSSGMFEVTISKHIISKKGLIAGDFFIRVFIVILDLIYLALDLNINVVNIITLICFILNIYLQTIIKKSWRYEGINQEEISIENRKKFLRDYYNEDTKFFMDIGLDKSNKIRYAVGKIEADEKIRRDFISLILLTFIFDIIYQNLFALVIIPVVLIVGVICLLLKNLFVMLEEGIRNNKVLRIYINMFLLVIGYIIIVFEKIIFKDELGYYKAITLVIGVLLFTPILKQRVEVLKEVNKIYKDYLEHYGDITIK